MNTITVSPIAGIDLKDVSQFLHTNLNSKIPVKTWRDSFHSQWSQSVPNFGFQLKNGGDLVGVICAIYSDQIIDGKIEFLCNPHSWCVLKDYRKQSINLVLAVLQQKGYHFTMFTPNPDVATVFRYLKFKDLSNIQTLYLHQLRCHLPRTFRVGTVRSRTRRLYRRRSQPPGSVLDGRWWHSVS